MKKLLKRRISWVNSKIINAFQLYLWNSFTQVNNTKLKLKKHYLRHWNEKHLINLIPIMSKNWKNLIKSERKSKVTLKNSYLISIQIKRHPPTNLKMYPLLLLKLQMRIMRRRQCFKINNDSINTIYRISNHNKILYF